MNKLSNLGVLLFCVGAAFLCSCSSDDNDNTNEEETGEVEEENKFDWNAAAEKATTSLITHFWDAEKHYFVYNNDQFENAPTNNYWPQAHAMDVVIDAYIRTGQSKYSDMFPQWFEGVKLMNWSNPGVSFLGEFYDDTAWIGLTIMRLYEVTQEEKYLTAAKEIMDYLEQGWNDKGGGGIAWATSHTESKNACTQGPSAILASKLYLATKEQTYLDWALKIFGWERDNLFNQYIGVVYDNLNGDTGDLNTTSWSYNQGTFVGAAHLLFTITGDEDYLNDARKAANYGITNSGNIDTSHNILRNEGSGDGGLFKGIFMRYFTDLILEDKLSSVYKEKFTAFLENNADVLWRTVADEEVMFFGPDWSKSVSSAELGSQVSGCTLFEMRAKLDKETN